MLMTRKELQRLYTRKTELFNTEQALQSLKDSYGKQFNSEGVPERVRRDISALEAKVQLEGKAIEAQTPNALKTLKQIEDDVARIGAMLHFCEGMPWDVAAAVLHCTSTSALKSAVYRGMNRANIQ